MVQSSICFSSLPVPPVVGERQQRASDDTYDSECFLNSHWLIRLPLTMANQGPRLTFPTRHNYTRDLCVRTHPDLSIRAYFLAKIIFHELARKASVVANIGRCFVVVDRVF